MRTCATIPLIVLVACTEADPREGIAIGNPPGMAYLRGVPAESAGVTYTSFFYEVDKIYLEDCDGNASTTDASGILDLTGEEPVSVPAGTWCAMGFSPVSPVLLNGEVDNGGSFTYTAEHNRLMVFGELDVPSIDPMDPVMPTGDLTLEAGLPDFVPEEILALGPSEQLTLGDDCVNDPVCSAIREAIMYGSAIYFDDGDGEISDNERRTGNAARGSERGE